jgi:hypothetical protein
MSDQWDRMVLWPVAAILGSYVISICASDYRNVALWRSLSMMVFAALLLGVQVCRKEPWAWRALLMGIVLLVVVVVVDVVWQRFSGTSLLREKGIFRKRWMGSQGNANDLAAIMFLAPIAYAYFPHRHRLTAYAIFMACLVPVWLISESRQVLLAWFVGMVIPIVSAVKRPLRLGIVVGILLVAIVVTLASPLLRMKLELALHEGVGVREQLAVLGLKLGWQHPFAGIGPGCFTEYFLQAYAEGWTWRGKQLPSAGTPWVHCMPAEIFCEFGLIGCVAFGMVLAAILNRLRRENFSNSGEDELVSALRGCWIAALLVSLIDVTLIKDWVRIDFWLLLGITFSVGASQALTDSVGTGELGISGARSYNASVC